jgi:hypothetical protein
MDYTAIDTGHHRLSIVDRDANGGLRRKAATPMRRDELPLSTPEPPVTL